MALYPLLLTPIYKEKVWGGRTLERMGRRLPGSDDTKVGESWEVVDLAETSPSGGGGAAAHSVIRNGPLLKRTLGEVARDFGPLVTGMMPLGPDGSFPLLLKYLDARENLSVQVHPSPGYAAANPDAHLKSEAWYIVDADPGAVLYSGLVPGTTAEAFRAAIEAGTVPTLMQQIPAEVGSCHYLPSGTCHALGAGVVAAEVQTASDTTFRVFDWGRTDRELHVDQAMACIFDEPEGSTPSDSALPDPIAEGDAVSRLLVSCAHFEICEWTLLRDGVHGFASDELAILMVVGGDGALEWGDETAHRLEVGPMDTVLLPAALEHVTLRSVSDMKILEVTPVTPPAT